MKVEFITYSLEIDEYMTRETGEDRYDVVRLEVWHRESGPEINEEIERENCTLLQAVEIIRQLTQARAALALTPARVREGG